MTFSFWVAVTNSNKLHNVLREGKFSVKVVFGELVHVFYGNDPG